MPSIINTDCPLVLRRFDVDPANSDGERVRIVGRRSGGASWLMVILGLDDETEFYVNKDGVTLEEASLKGQKCAVVPP
jgi:hypothetical protein